MNKLIYNDINNNYTVPDGIGDDKLRIAIMMLNSPNIPKYAHKATIINYLYASKYGYDFIVERIPLNINEKWHWDNENEYTLVWYKPEFIKKHLKNYHYVLYIDSDAFIQNMNIKIEDIIKKYNICLTFQEDLCYFTDISVSTNNINTGLILVKNCKDSLNILDTWIRAPYTEPELFEYRNNHPREQYVIQWIRNKYNLYDKINVIGVKEQLFGQYNSKWIIHLVGVNNEQRNNILDERYKSILEFYFYDKPLSYIVFRPLK